MAPPKGFVPWNKKESIKKNCLNCLNEYEVPPYRAEKTRFCSGSCRASYNFKGRQSPMKGRRQTEFAKIKISKKLLGKKKSEEHVNHMREKIFSEEHKKNLSKTQWCRNRENRIRISGSNSYLWIDGRSFLPYCSKFNEQLKEQIRERDNRTCQLCGVKENGKKLAVHHIHYDKENCEPDLITLCTKCNTRVNHNRDYWEQFFMKKLMTLDRIGEKTADKIREVCGGQY